jgi:hypothetical protein
LVNGQPSRRRGRFRRTAAGRDPAAHGDQLHRAGHGDEGGTAEDAGAPPR